MLSDGEDTSSLLSFEEVLDLAKRSDTAIYSIGLRSDEEANASKGFKEAEFVLKQFSQQTGGRSFFPQHIDELTNDEKMQLAKSADSVKGLLDACKKLDTRLA